MTHMQDYLSATSDRIVASKRIANRFIINDLARDLLGRGSMGAVYRAHDTLTDTAVAIKALNPDLISDTGRAAEASHP